MIDATIRFRSRLSPYAPALSHAAGQVSFRQLDADVGAVAAHLRVRFGAQARSARIEVRSAVLAWAVAAAAERIGWTVVLARPVVGGSRETDRDGDVVLTDVAGEAHATVARIEPLWLKPPADGPVVVGPDAPGGAGADFDAGDGGGADRLRLCAEAVDRRIGEVDWLLPASRRVTCLIGPETPFGLAVVLRQWMAGGCVVTPAPKAPLAGLGSERRVDLLVLRPAQLAGLLDALAPDAAPAPGLRVVVAGGAAPRALTMAAHLRLASEVVLVHESPAEGILAMGVDIVARQDSEIGPLAPWLDADRVFLPPGLRVTERGILTLDAVAAP